MIRVLHDRQNRGPAKSLAEKINTALALTATKCFYLRSKNSPAIASVTPRSRCHDGVS